MNLFKRIIQHIISINKRRKIMPIYKHLLLEIQDYLQQRGVHLIYVEPPFEYKIKGLNAFELERINNWTFDFNKFEENKEYLNRLYGEGVTQDYIQSVFDGGIVVQGNKRKMLLDFSSDNQHIVNGRRITIGQPATYHNTIYTHGACTWRGTGVEDSQTIASYLQDRINKLFSNAYRVVNSAIGRGSTVQDDFQFIKEQNYQKGDIVILGSFGGLSIIPRSFYNKHKIPYLESSHLFDRPHDYGEWFLDNTLHTTAKGNEVIANAIFNKLNKDLHWLSSEPEASEQKIAISDKHDLPSNLTTGEKVYGDNPALLEFIQSLQPYKKEGRNGSIVMNCNPFTLGHRYLIEYAASRVDNLYIFVVEEDKSYFSFEDRINLMRQGTEDLKNVIVLPSGKFIISATTFPGYFYKDDIKEATIDCSNDLTVFAQYIAPALDIRIRFAGEEPLDPVTNQYNEGMKEILPQYGIEFHPIARKCDTDGSQVISASRVRKYFESGDLESLKSIVPSTTYRYLYERYQREHGH